MFVPYFKYCMKLLPVLLNKGHSRSEKGSQRARMYSRNYPYHTRNAQIGWDSSVYRRCGFGSCYDRDLQNLYWQHLRQR